MYIVPHTGKRAVLRQDRDATINAAHTRWGKRRTDRPLIANEVNYLRISRFCESQRRESKRINVRDLMRTLDDIEKKLKIEVH